MVAGRDRGRYVAAPDPGRCLSLPGVAGVEERVEVGALDAYAAADADRREVSAIDPYLDFRVTPNPTPRRVLRLVARRSEFA